ncbi:MAG: CDP-glucose 4,6-dehydratase [Actinomycetota bacterium]
MEDVVVTATKELDPSFWRHRAVAVTGATGFLGSHLTKMLVDFGADVVALVRDRLPLTPITAAWVGRVSIVEGDITDQALVERMLGEYEVRTVLHLAAQTQVGVSNRNPVSTFDANIRGTWAALEAARRSPRVEQIVVASSDKAYGAQPVLPYTEDMPLLAVNPYDVSKACADMLSLSYHETFDLPVSITRCGNFFGPGDTNWERLVPGSIRALLSGERPIVRSDGTPTRDYLHVEDGARAYLLLAESMARDPKVVGRPFNFSTETPVTVIELLAMIQRIVGAEDLRPDVQSTATHEIPHQFLSATQARDDLGWAPRYDLDAALRQTVGWYRDFLRDNEP